MGMNDERLGHTSPPARLLAWPLTVLAALVPLAFSPDLGDSFELPKLVLLKVGLAMMLLMLAARSSAAVDVSIARTPAGLAALLVLSTNVLATLGSVEPRTSLLGNYGVGQGLLTVAIGVAYFWLAASWIRTGAALTWLAAGLALAAAVSSGYAIVQYAGLDPLAWLNFDATPVFGTLGNPNGLGEFLAMTLPLTAWLAWSGRGLRRDLPLWGLGLQVVALVMTQARAAWLTVLLQVLVVGLLAIRGGRESDRWGRLLILAPQAAALIGFALLLVAPPSALGIDAIDERAIWGLKGEPLQSRRELWHSTLAMIADRPVLGWGPDTFELAYPAYRSPALDARLNVVLRPETAHNAVLVAAFNAGLPAAAAYVGLHLTIVLVLQRAIFRSHSTTPTGPPTAALALLLSWGSYAILFVPGQPHVTTDWLAWMIGGAAVGLFGARAGTWRAPTGQPLAPLVRLGTLALVLGLLVEAGSGLAADAAYGRAYATDQSDSPSPSLVWLRRAVDLRPFEPVYRRALGLGLVDLARETDDPARFALAVEQLERASALSGERDAELLIRLARATLEWEAASGHVTDAPLVHARRALELDPLNPLFRAEAADLAVSLGRWELAREHWQTARAMARSADALQRLGEVAMRLGGTLAARDAFRAATERPWRTRFVPMHARSWGEAALAAGLADEAARAFGRALELAPNDVRTRIRRAETLAMAGRRAEAMEEAGRALDQAPADPRAAALVERLGRP